MEKDFVLTELFDIYGCLLTDRQKELFAGYYLYDLSLAEIAEPEGKTRQNVYEQVKKVKQKLIAYEKLLHIKEKNDCLKNLAQNIEAQNPQISKKITEIIGE
jgi:predicted DNA-binding protein YlxM (UPF0122 family)